MGIRVRNAHFVVRCHMRFSWRLRLLLLLRQRQRGQKLQVLLVQAAQVVYHVMYHVRQPSTHLYFQLVRVVGVLEGMLIMQLALVALRGPGLLSWPQLGAQRIHVTCEWCSHAGMSEQGLRAVLTC